MIVLLLTAALAQEPPEGVELEPFEQWTSGARTFDKGPDGCWEFSGDLMLRLMHHAGATAFGRAEERDTTVRGDVSAIYDGHVWTRFHYTLDADKEPWMTVRPFWGKVEEGAIQHVDEDGEIIVDEDMQEARERFEQAQERRGRRGNRTINFSLGGDGDEDMLEVTSLEEVAWDETAREVRLREEAEFRGIGRGTVVTTYHFPEGAPRPTAMDVALPGSIQFGRWPLQGSIREGAIHVRMHPASDELLLPLAQRFSGIAQIFGQTFGVDSQVRFLTAQPCTSAAPAGTEPNGGETTEPGDDEPAVDAVSPME